MDASSVAPPYVGQHLSVPRITPPTSVCAEAGDDVRAQVLRAYGVALHRTEALHYVAPRRFRGMNRPVPVDSRPTYLTSPKGERATIPISL